VLGLTCLALVATVAAVQFIRLAQLRTEVEEKQQQLARLERSVQHRMRAASVVAVGTREQGQRLNEQKHILDSLRYPWNRMLSEVEQNDREKVAILSFSHSQTGAVTQLSVEAIDVATLVDYVNAFNRDQADIHWYLASHQAQVQRSPATLKGEIIRK
jgi:signal transduction histidine kinase